MSHYEVKNLAQIALRLAKASASLEEALAGNIKFINVSEEPSAKQYHEAMASLTHAIMDATRLLPLPRTKFYGVGTADGMACPIFIGGSHKSGTTLLRNLLDGHESLNVLPGDGHGIRYAERLYSIDAGHHEFAIVNTILHCTAMPIAGEQPRWVLGNDPMDYVRVGEVVRQQLADGAANPKQILDIFAYSFQELSMPANLTQLSRKWVEKSTNNIEDACSLLRLYPRAKFLHIVRHPGAIIAAQKRKQSLKNREYSLTRELETIHQSMRYGLSNRRYIGNAQYYILRFEDLVSDTENMMRSIAKFLDISYSEILIQPTVFGKHAGSNTSRSDERTKPAGVDPVTSERWMAELSSDEANLIEGFFAGLLNFYFYKKNSISKIKTSKLYFKLCSSEMISNTHYLCFIIITQNKILEIYHKFIITLFRNIRKNYFLKYLIYDNKS